MASVPEHRAAIVRGIPRTSSIDSAISNISASTHAHKASTESLARGESPDIGGLIQAAGSPEAVIQHLLKEKASQAAQNSQLWRLVDKQRAMILGLNKDLERALKDKERYRKKAKDSVSGISTDMGKTGAEKACREDNKPRGDVGRGMGAMVAASLRDADYDQNELQPPSLNGGAAPYPVTPPVDSGGRFDKSQSSQNMADGEHKMPDTASYAPNNFSPDARKGFQQSRQQERQNMGTDEMSPRSLPLRPQTADSQNAPTLHLTEASPKSTRDGALRKAPPAPLNLGKHPQTSAHLHQAESGDELDSDYDDVLEAGEIPLSSDRGRRKTREEDDRERETAAMRDADARSLSKKSKSKSDAPGAPQEPVPAIRQVVQISPPERSPNRLAANGSLAGMLNNPVPGPNEPKSDVTKRTVLGPPPMSAGLPACPRPMAGMNSPFPRNANLAPSNVAPGPMSARMGQFPAMPLSPRAPRQPIPLPPNKPRSTTVQSPAVKAPEPPTMPSPKPTQMRRLAEEEAESPRELKRSPGFTAVTEPGEIYRGFIIDDYPDLLLPPNALPLIEVRVASSRLKPSRASIMFPNKMEDDPVFTLAVFSRADGQELWRVEKDSLSLSYLDQDLKRHKSFSSLKTPERSLFSGHAPVKIDARRAALDKYMDDVLNTEMNTKSAMLLCHYFSTNTVEPLIKMIRPIDFQADSPTHGMDYRPCKHGYLTKRGKNFGGWKARYFVLDGPILKYFESPPPSGPVIGAIKLQNSKIGKQQQQAQDSQEDADNQYRHAFLILEPKKKDSSSIVRHVLCAESDQERDEWVDALVQYMETPESDDEASNDGTLGRNDSSSSSRTGASSRKKGYGQKQQSIPEQDDDLRAMPYEATVPGQAPRQIRSRNKESGTPTSFGADSQSLNSRETDTPTPPPGGQMPHSESVMSISGPQNATKIEDGAVWGNRPGQPPVEDKRNQKKRSFFGFGGNKQRPSSESQDHIEISNLSQMCFEQHGPIRAVFGAPLAEAVKYNHPVDVDIELPAVVYRCVEYLEEKNAVSEEGIFRLSGSNVVIKALRERFNVEGDVDLITDGQYYDMHAVASLLKLYLRELPTTILTRELHLDFLAVTEIADTEDKVKQLCVLVHRLPKANNTLLRYLSNFLINVITNCEVNKMTVRNVGIVFSPTINIPAPVLALFLQRYEAIFEAEPEEHDERSSVEVTVTAPLTPEDIRSPRRQQFQELPTPSYNQDSFPRGHAPAAPGSAQPNKAAYDTGFIPVNPSYDAQPAQGERFGSMNQAPSESYDQFPVPSGAIKHFGNGTGLNPPSPVTSRQKRRESSMFGMMGAKKPAEEKRKTLNISSPLSAADFG